MSDEGSDADLRSLHNRTPDEDRIKAEVTPEELDLLRRYHRGDLDVSPRGPESPRHRDWAREEFRRHMAVEQGLSTSTGGSKSTVEYTLQYIDFLDRGGICQNTGLPTPPVELRPPDEASWKNHVESRLDDGADGNTLDNYRLAMKRLLTFLGIPIWPILDEPYDAPDPDWTLPLDDVVPRFWHVEHHEDPYLAATYAHIFRFGFMVGVRPPSEIVVLDLDDVDFEANRITVTEAKKGGNRRHIEDVADHILTATTEKSVKNYVEHWRPKVDPEEEKDALFLTSEGERFSRGYLRNQLSRLGKAVWRQFQPYTMRRWFATKFLIANDYNVYLTADRLGDETRTVENRYLDKAKIRGEAVGEVGMPRLRGGSDGR